MGFRGFHRTPEQPHCSNFYICSSYQQNTACLKIVTLASPYNIGQSTLHLLLTLEYDGILASLSTIFIFFPILCPMACLNISKSSYTTFCNLLVLNECYSLIYS